MTTVYCANIPFRATEDQLKKLFEECGTVESCKIVTDRETGKSRGFAFIEMPNADQAKKAIDELDGAEFQGRNLVVNMAKPKAR